jgi:hypothetical protein
MAQYLEHWLGIFTAASKASDAAAFLQALQGA